MQKIYGTHVQSPLFGRPLTNEEKLKKYETSMKRGTVNDMKQTIIDQSTDYDEDGNPILSKSQKNALKGVSLYGDIYKPVVESYREQVPMRNTRIAEMQDEEEEDW
ncbi:UNKNOWN [Stylonychia lemnae]|uniref:Uncharacterized protein n=1 Tax=Stylonychia lemnae TaxID=5949 RepID=A0A078A5Q5_STYLE|nr:UNKNOWN [Stylonychia lemnae]|eukprot:CDW77241.1 UNKNOWN [Stylonychia lemnae]